MTPTHTNNMDIIFLLCVHWVADFILQTRKQANNKSRSLKALLSHTTVYSLCWFVLWPVLGTNTLWFMLVTFIAHTLTDFVTSKASAWAYIKSVNPFILLLNSRVNAGDELQPFEGPSVKVLYKVEDDDLGNKYLVTDLKQNDSHMHLFWSIIGGDQFLHTAQLIITYNLL